MNGLKISHRTVFLITAVLLGAAAPAWAQFCPDTPVRVGVPGASASVGFGDQSTSYTLGIQAAPRDHLLLDASYSALVVDAVDTSHGLSTGAAYEIPLADGYDCDPDSATGRTRFRIRIRERRILALVLDQRELRSDGRRRGVRGRALPIHAVRPTHVRLRKSGGRCLRRWLARILERGCGCVAPRERPDLRHGHGVLQPRRLLGLHAPTGADAALSRAAPGTAKLY